MYFTALTIIEAIRATGNSKIPLILLTSIMILNIILDPIFILAGYGIAGAAIATAISMIVGLIINIIYIKKKSELLCFNVKNIKFEKSFVKKALTIGIPMMIEELSTIITIMLEVNISNSLGIVGSTAYGVVSKLQQVIWIIGGSVRTLLTVVVGQFIGKYAFDELKNVMKNGIKIIVVPTIIILLFMVFAAQAFCKIFTSSEEVIETAINYLSIVGFAFGSVPLCQLLYGFVLGTGNTRYTFFSCLVSSIVEVITVLVINNKYNTPLTALGIGILLWYVFEISLCAIYYWSKRWKKVVENA